MMFDLFNMALGLYKQGLTQPGMNTFVPLEGNIDLYIKILKDKANEYHRTN